MSFTKEDKIKFLREQYPDIEKINFITSQAMFLEVKRKLVDAGFYRVRGINEVGDSSIFNLIKMAQNKVPFRNVSSKRRKPNEPR